MDTLTSMTEGYLIGNKNTIENAGLRENENLNGFKIKYNNIIEDGKAYVIKKKDYELKPEYDMLSPM